MKHIISNRREKIFVTKEIVKRDFVFVDDVIKAFYKTMKTNLRNGEIINIGTGKQYSNKEIAHLLRSVAAVYLLTGGNRFKQIAYENAAGIIEQLSREVRDIWQENKLTDIPGIGASIASSLE